MEMIPPPRRFLPGLLRQRIWTISQFNMDNSLSSIFIQKGVFLFLLRREKHVYFWRFAD